jgi:hypothetical protein
LAIEVRWRDQNELKRLKELDAGHSKLESMYADLAPEKAAIKDVVSRKLSRACNS